MASASTHTDERRLGCADRAISSGKPATRAAEELGAHCKTLRRWARRRRGRLDGKADAKGLQNRIRGLEQENEFLKKAGAFFAADHARCPRRRWRRSSTGRSARNASSSGKGPK